MTATVEEFSLEPGIVYIREQHLATPESELEQMRSVLTKDEVRRADRFRFPRHRRRFIMAHATLRKALGNLVGERPEALRFQYGNHGKPSLVDGPSFNISRSGERLLLAFTQEGRLGIDIEEIRPVREMQSLAEKKFSADEYELLMAAPVPLRPATFFRIWTRKEAYLKALGTGLSTSLASFSVDLGAGTSNGLVRVDDSGERPDEWWVAGVACGEGAEAAVAIDRRHVGTAALPG